MKDNRKMKQAMAYLRKKAGKIKIDTGSIKVSYDARIGLTKQSIIQYSKEKYIDIIIMTTHGKSGLKKLFLGSTTDAMIRESGKPVLVRRPGTGNNDTPKKPAFQKLLVCLDGTKAAETIVPYAESMAQLFDSRITLLQVVESGDIEKTGITPVFTPVLEKALDAENYLKHIAEKIEEKNIDAITETLPLLKGDIGGSILEYMGEHDVDLTMLTSHGEGGFEKTFTGSVCDKLLKESSKPLFIINPSQMTG
jgi:nucleotide-binding universal stress UspA family protein